MMPLPRDMCVMLLEDKIKTRLQFCYHDFLTLLYKIVELGTFNMNDTICSGTKYP